MKDFQFEFLLRRVKEILYQIEKEGENFIPECELESLCKSLYHTHTAKQIAQKWAEKKWLL